MRAASRPVECAGWIIQLSLQPSVSGVHRLSAYVTSPLDILNTFFDGFVVSCVTLMQNALLQLCCF